MSALPSESGHPDQPSTSPALCQISGSAVEPSSLVFDDPMSGGNRGSHGPVRMEPAAVIFIGSSYLTLWHCRRSLGPQHRPYSHEPVRTRPQHVVKVSRDNSGQRAVTPARASTRRAGGDMAERWLWVLLKNPHRQPKPGQMRNPHLVKGRQPGRPAEYLSHESIEGILPEELHQKWE